MCAYNVLQPLQVYIAIIAQLNTIYLFVYTIKQVNSFDYCKIFIYYLQLVG